MTQKELATRAGLSQGFISLCERGRQNPSIGSLGRIAEALDIPPRYLINSRLKSINSILKKNDLD